MRALLALVAALLACSPDEGDDVAQEPAGICGDLLASTCSRDEDCGSGGARCRSGLCILGSVHFRAPCPEEGCAAGACVDGTCRLLAPGAPCSADHACATGRCER